MEILESASLFVNKVRKNIADASIQINPGVMLNVDWHLFLSTIMFKRGCSLEKDTVKPGSPCVSGTRGACKIMQNNASTVLLHHIQKSTLKLPPSESRASGWLCASLSAHKHLWCVSAEPPDAHGTG